MNSAVSSRSTLIVIAGTLLWCLSGCASTSSTSTSRKSTLPREDIDRLVTEYIRSLNWKVMKGNLDAFLDDWADDLDYTVSLATMRTKEELREFLGEWSGMFSKWRHVEVRRVVQGNLVAWEGVAKGNHRTTGKPLEIPMVMILEFDGDGKIRMSHVYFDTGVLQQQLLAEPLVRP